MPATAIVVASLGRSVGRLRSGEGSSAGKNFCPSERSLNMKCCYPFSGQENALVCWFGVVHPCLVWLGRKETERWPCCRCWPDMEERKKATSGGGGGGPIDFRFSPFLPSFSAVAALFTMFNSAVSATSHFRDGEKERERERERGATIRFLPSLLASPPLNSFFCGLCCAIFSLKTALHSRPGTTRLYPISPVTTSLSFVAYVLRYLLQTKWVFVIWEVNVIMMR